MMYSAILSFLILLVVLNEFSLANSYHRYFCPNCFKRSEYPLRFKIFNRFGNEDCVHQICDDDETYPYKTIETKMKESMEFKKYFGTIIEPHRKPTITNRFGEVDNSNLTNMCKTAYHTRYPKVAINKEGLEKYIVNTEEFKQAVSFETCASDGSKCWCDDCFPLGYESVCKQQYINVKLVALYENGTVGLDVFPIPSNCVCTYSQEKYL